MANIKGLSLKVNDKEYQGEDVSFRQNKIVDIMEKNAEASLKIKADKMRRGNDLQKIDLRKVNEIRKQLKSKTLPMDVMLQSYDNHIEQLKGKISRLKSLKYKNKGTLRPGDENNLLRFQAALQDEEAKKQAFIESQQKPVAAKKED